MVKVAVVSSVYGEYDAPAVPVEQIMPVEYVLVTDREYEAGPWKVVVEPRPQLHPRLAAKVAKCRPDLYADADIYIWLDASVDINSPTCVTNLIAQLRDAPLAQFRHHSNHTLRIEMRVAGGMPKYQGLPIRRQGDHYISEGFDGNSVLWETGCIVYRRDTPSILGPAWLAEQVRWTYEDQISEAPVLRRLGLQPIDLVGGNVYGNPFFSVRQHGKDT